MIYCPHCNRPSARAGGPCPHCKGELSTLKTNEQTEPAISAPRPEAAPSANNQLDHHAVELDETRGSGLEISTSESPPAPSAPAVVKAVSDKTTPRGDDSGLDLVSLDPKPASGMMAGSADQPVEMDEFAVREAARFGTPRPGIVGALKYWLLVRRRLKELTIEHDKAAEKSYAAMEQKRAFEAEIGRKAKEIGINRNSLAPLMSRATLADGELKSASRRQKELEAEHQSKLEPLEAAEKKIEAEAAPLREQEKRVMEEYKRLDTDRRRVEAKMKRAEIELRNIEELIQKRQESYADPERPKEKRDQLLKEIAGFDNKQPAIQNKINACEEELSTLAKPIAEVESRLIEIRDNLDDKQQKIDAIQTEINSLARAFSAGSSELTGQLEKRTDESDVAWASVGEQIVEKQYDEPELGQLKSKLLGAKAATSEAQREMALLEHALTSYDHDVVAQAKKIAAACAAAIVALIVLLIIFG